MNETTAACAALALLALFAAGHGTDGLKTKRQSGLFPFPRVGRAGENTWDYGRGSSGYSCPTCYNPSWNSKGEGKRQGLIPFPRVGRSGPRGPASAPASAGAPLRLAPAAALLLMDAAAAAAAAPELSRRGAALGLTIATAEGDAGDAGESRGMWFGPRLGRRDRRSPALDAPAWTIVPLADLSSARRHEGFSSEEEADEESEAAAAAAVAAALAGDGSTQRGAPRTARSAPAPAAPSPAAAHNPHRG